MEIRPQPGCPQPDSGQSLGWEVDLATLWIVQEMLEVVEGILAMVETLVEEEAVVVEVVAAEVVMER
ncbi:hypothetical protein H920_20158 [Fukomys damarensis]|uniref:Uncharacterized protein n=1 Tax=Fukomys damarensis TaxID=885580 RepID=A0A091CM43_FUKDA|nr:hypothetical protein H920_20158 [Fukomys damarensis]